MTITDAIILSGGFKNNADGNVTLSRNRSSDNGLVLVENIKFSFDENYKTENDILLKKDDIITARIIPFERLSNSFQITGEVDVPGTYSIDLEKMNINEALKKIQFTKNANVNQIYIFRDGIKVPVDDRNSSSFIIISGDNIVVPSYDNVVKVTGSIQQASILDLN